MHSVPRFPKGSNLTFLSCGSVGKYPRKPDAAEMAPWENIKVENDALRMFAFPVWGGGGVKRGGQKEKALEQTTEFMGLPWLLITLIKNATNVEIGTKLTLKTQIML